MKNFCDLPLLSRDPYMAYTYSLRTAACLLLDFMQLQYTFSRPRL